MTEIKEIFRRMNDLIEHQFDKEYHTECDLFKDIQDLLDYITNLQQENEFLKLNNPEMNIEHFRIVKENKRKIDNLRKENKILKENAEHNDKVVDKARWNEMIYKSRCEKLQNFITNLISELNHCELNGTKKLDIVSDYIKQEYENILNGSDEK